MRRMPELYRRAGWASAWVTQFFDRGQAWEDLRVEPSIANCYAAVQSATTMEPPVPLGWLEVRTTASHSARLCAI